MRRLNIPMRILTFICACSLIMLSCDYVGQRSYDIYNATSGPIKVFAVIKRYTTNDTVNKILQANQKETIASEELGIHVQVTKPDSLPDILMLNIYKSDTIKLKRDARPVSNWTFEKSSKYFGTCTQTITDADF